ncbi:hypothetical protein L2E82_17917 [Cichorium intybus]|uniref:Uncharacterized protein n=1 Tax=Cichorium intybus TaxID=13427 RepID=A0ACB9FA15_CICIN|nr:hypothetical protein L2E82_17917 [Cichorium intybus]
MVFDTIRNKLADTFVNNVTTSYRAEISDFGRGINFRNERKDGAVEGFKKFARIEEFLNSHTEIRTHNIPSSLEELSRETIRTRSFIITHLEQNTLNLRVSNRSKHGGRLEGESLLEKREEGSRIAVEGWAEPKKA